MRLVSTAHCEKAESSATAGTYPASWPCMDTAGRSLTGSVMNSNAEAVRRKSDDQERFRIVDVEERRSARQLLIS
jgi:hypothetical protein